MNTFQIRSHALLALGAVTLISCTPETSTKHSPNLPRIYFEPGDLASQVYTDSAVTISIVPLDSNPDSYGAPVLDADVAALKSHVIVLDPQGQTIPHTIEDVPPQKKPFLWTQFQIKAAFSNSGWYFVGFSSIPEAFQGDLAHVGTNQGVRLNTASAPTVKYVSFCPQGNGTGKVTVGFNQAVLTSDNALRVNADTAECTMQPSAYDHNSEREFACPSTNIQEIHVSLTAGITGEDSAHTPFAAVTGASSLDLTLEQSNAQTGSGCFQWTHLQ